MKRLVPFHLSLAFLIPAALVGTSRLHAQQDGLIAHPDVYRVQFENDWVRLVRVTLPANSSLPEHTHPPGVMLHVYFNDADPVVFEHDGSPGSITRPYVQARSYRVGRATPETHAVINRGGVSDFMRIELKTSGDPGFGRRIPAPPLGDSTRAVVEVTNSQFRASRITVAAGQSFEVMADSAAPALIIALTDGIAIDAGSALRIGQEQFVDVGRRALIKNVGAATVELLRVDFLARP